MKQKILDMLESHVDKLILGVIAIVALAILWFFVIGTPYGGEVNRVTCSPGSIDAKIKETAVRVEERINGEATVKSGKYKGNKAGKYLAIMETTVEINDKVIIPISTGSRDIEDKRFYRMPEIPSVAGVDAQLIRTAVFVPTEKVDMSMSYEQAKTDVVDIDFITVEASFDTSKLYKNFKQSFVNGVTADYKDEDLAVPVFASVGLERQVLGEDGQWSDWQSVSRPNIDKRREMFVVPDKAQDIDLGGIEVLVMTFEEFAVQKDLLQPTPYEVAASNAEWLTPTYHKELTEIIAKEKRDAEIAATGRYVRPKRVSERERENDRNRRRNPRDKRKPTPASRRDRTIEDIRADFNFAKLTTTVDLSIMKEPLIFWGFDADIEPHKSYRYRIRLGVFNPTAGKGWFSGAATEFKDDVVLWSEYSEVTEAIAIDPMVYFFPLELAKHTKAAAIQVSKFHGGKWQSEEFDVRVGESIGYVVEIEEEDSGARRVRAKKDDEVKEIDFASGAVLVDIVSSRRSVIGGRPYQEILYSENGGAIKHLGVSKRNWSKSMLSTFKTIADQQDIVVEIFKTRGQSGGGMYPGGMEGYEGMDGMGGFGPGGFEGFGEF